MHSVNDLVSDACKHSLNVFKGSCVFLSSKQNRFVVCSIVIRTRNYATTPYIDRTDMLDKSDKEDIFKTWTVMLEDGNLHPVEERRLCNQFLFVLSLVLEFTRRKQIIVKQIVLFVFPTLGISDHIQNYETHMWVARVIQHTAVILVFIAGTNVTFGQQKRLSGGLGWL